MNDFALFVELSMFILTVFCRIELRVRVRSLIYRTLPSSLMFLNP